MFLMQEVTGKLSHLCCMLICRKVVLIELVLGCLNFCLSMLVLYVLEWAIYGGTKQKGWQRSKYPAIRTSALKRVEISY